MILLHLHETIISIRVVMHLELHIKWTTYLSMSLPCFYPFIKMCSVCSPPTLFPAITIPRDNHCLTFCCKSLQVRWQGQGSCKINFENTVFCNLLFFLIWQWPAHIVIVNIVFKGNYLSNTSSKNGKPF